MFNNKKNKYFKAKLNLYIKEKFNGARKIIFYTLITTLFLSLVSIAWGDMPADDDNDGISNTEEIEIYHTNPNYYDTDGDGYDDKTEIDNGYSPRHANSRQLRFVDSDGDKLSDKWELDIGTNLLDNDTDNDGYDDNTEVMYSYDPLLGNAVKAKKFIKVDITKQELSYYFNGKILESFSISGGVASMPTPKGTFKVLEKVPSKNYGGYGYNFYYPNTKWNLHFTTNYYRYYIHGAYWHDNFGYPMSHGCINVAYQDMEKLYEWADLETKIEIY